ncbi:MAG: hypothetical protein U0704_10475 [Candidatus Eisenbacteria bacterium]
MMDTAVVTTDLDRLAARVEKAAQLVQDLRFKLATYEQAQTKLETEKATLESSMKQLEEQKSSLEDGLQQLQAEKSALEKAGAEAAALLAQAEADKATLQSGQDKLSATLQQVEGEKSELATRLEEMGAKLQGADPSVVVSELAALKKEQREWTAERKDVASRIEALLKKLDRIDA